MSIKEFYRLVEEMRNTQKLYFTARYSSTLQRALALQKEVDEEIKRFNEEINHELAIDFTEEQ